MIFNPEKDCRCDRLYVHGSKGIIKSEVEYNQSGKLGYKVITEDGVFERSIDAKQNYALEIGQLGRVIEDREEQHITPEFSIRQAEILDQVLSCIGY